MLDTLSRWIMALHYPGIALLTALENLFPPLPTEPVISLAGYAAARGEMTVAGLILAGTVGSVLGSLPLYLWGKRLGETRFLAWCERKGARWGATKERGEQVLGWFRRYGGWAIVIARLAPGARSLVSIPAGMSGIGMPRFLLFTTLGSALRMAQLTLLGVLLSEGLLLLGRFGLVAGAVGLLAFLLGFWFWRRKRLPLPL